MENTNNHLILSEKYILEMIKGYDKNNIPFTAFILLNNEEKNNLSNLIFENKKINLTQYNIICKTIGHTVSQKVINEIIQTIKFNKNFI